MIRGARVGLRARHPDDVPLLHRELENNAVERSRSDPRPWAPIPLDESAFRIRESDDAKAVFSVVELAEGEPLAGAAVLWGIDRHNRYAHFGLSLLPAFRGRGLSVDVLRLLCHYSFVLQGLHRVQLETMDDNHAMIGAARRCGFTHEATLRETAWVNGSFGDEVVYGLLREEWLSRADRSAAPSPGG